MEPDFVSSENSVLRVEVDLKVFSLDALLKTAYWYTGRCYLHLQFSGSETVVVRLKAKVGAAEKDIPERFLNDLLDQTVRERVTKETEPVRNLILAHALSKTSLVNSGLESAEPASDPAAIALSDAAKANL